MATVFLWTYKTNSTTIFITFHTCHILRATQPSSFHRRNNICQGVQITELFTLQFSPFSWYFTRLGSSTFFGTFLYKTSAYEFPLMGKTKIPFSKVNFIIYIN